MIWYGAPKNARIVRLQEISLKDLEHIHNGELKYMKLGLRNVADMAWREMVRRAGGLG